MLLYDIGKAGYDVRYKIQDLSQYGLVQKRKRLLIIAARYAIRVPHAHDTNTDMFQTGYASPSLSKAHTWRPRKWVETLCVHRSGPQAHHPPGQSSHERLLPSAQTIRCSQISLRCADFPPRLYNNRRYNSLPSLRHTPLHTSRTLSVSELPIRV